MYILYITCIHYIFIVQYIYIVICIYAYIISILYTRLHSMNYSINILYTIKCGYDIGNTMLVWVIFNIIQTQMKIYS